MSWLTPIGFLGLIGLIILIIIYIIKPNYQQKFISSTFIWKLSLRYKKKKIPITSGNLKEFTVIKTSRGRRQNRPVHRKDLRK